MKHENSRTRMLGARALAWAGALVLTTAGIAVATESLASAAPATGSPQLAPQHVAYLGHTFTVPSGWSVVNLAKNPTACVRFDVHAIYFGTPSAAQKCAAQGTGPVEAAILVSPAPSAGAKTGKAASAQDDAIEQRITATLGNVQITASYGTDRSVVTRILASAAVPAPRVESVATSAATKPVVQTRSALALGATAAAESTAAAMTYYYVGLGFDACTAPSTAQMTAWSASPYTAVGFYLGGADRGCAQPELTASWVSTEVAANWRLLPLYVGPQAVPNPPGPSELASPAAQGTASANDAVTQAQALGLGQGSLLYYDMEGATYTAADSAAVEVFLNAWTTQLHALGYYSAVYGQEDGSLAVLNADWGKMAEPNVIDVDNPNGLQNDDPGADPANHWTGYRVHQLVANSTQTYGGVSIQVDEDYLGVYGSCPATTTGGAVVQPHLVRNCGTGSVPIG
jgi:hypothetical protein